MTAVLEDIKPQIGDMLDQFNLKINDYIYVFLDARNIMNDAKENGINLTLEQLNDIFEQFNKSKQEMINYYVELPQEQAREYLLFLSTKFSGSAWAEKRCIWEVIAWINNIIINNHKV